MPELTGRCPMCEAELVVTRLQCNRCGTGLQGSFTLNRFDRLTREQLRFVDVFVKNRGVIRDVERELSISYPTVRSRLDEVIRALGYDASPESAAQGAAGQGATGVTAEGAAGGAAPAGVRTSPGGGAPPGVSPEHRRVVLDRLAAGQISADQAIELLNGKTAGD